jgi:phosphate:Na+ symporter
VEWLVKDRPLEEEGLLIQSKYLDEELLSTPSLALDRVRLETLHMGEQVQHMMTRIMPAILDGDREALNEVQRMDDTVDILQNQIVEYMGRISKGTLTDSQTSEFLRLMEAVNDLENIGDIIETNMVVSGHDLIDKGVTISTSTHKVLTDFHNAVTKAVAASVQAVSQNNQRAAQTVTTMKQEIAHIVETSAAYLADRLVVDEPNRIPTYTIEVDILEQLKRIYYFSKRMAKTVLPAEL